MMIVTSSANKTAQDAKEALRYYADAKKAEFLQRFFKTGDGQYAEGDRFLGITVPIVRKVARDFKKLTFKELQKLLNSKFHEDRLFALVVLVHQFQIGEASRKKDIFDFYLNNTERINNWDLVDVSCRDIVGAFLWDKNRGLLYQLAKSKSLWERRIAIVSTFYFIQKGDPTDTLRLTKVLLKDTEDLIHKAAGWMLREVGKRVDQKVLTNFLDQYSQDMPRTMLRYSIERLPPSYRVKFMQAKQHRIGRPPNASKCS